MISTWVITTNPPFLKRRCIYSSKAASVQPGRDFRVYNEAPPVSGSPDHPGLGCWCPHLHEDRVRRPELRTSPLGASIYGLLLNELCQHLQIDWHCDSFIFLRSLGSFHAWSEPFESAARVARFVLEYDYAIVLMLRTLTKWEIFISSAHGTNLLFSVMICLKSLLQHSQSLD